jgi:carbon monoxide dehydrogenase subunit G
MDMTGEQRIEQSREAVWEALNDSEVLRLSIPGCQSVERVSDAEYRITVHAIVGPIRALFKGKMLLADRVPPSAYRIEFDGQGGSAGFAKGGAAVELIDDGAATVLRYRAQAAVGGKLAQVGSRMIETTARKMADEFFTNFKAALQPVANDAPRAPAAPIRVAVPIWVYALLGLAVLAAAYFVLR